MYLLQKCFLPIRTFISFQLWPSGWRKQTWASCRSCPPWLEFSEQLSSSWVAGKRKQYKSMTSMTSMTSSRKYTTYDELEHDKQWAVSTKEAFCFMFLLYTTKLKAVNRQRCTITEGVFFKKGVCSGRHGDVRWQDWSTRAGCSAYTHFPRKVCTVEFGVVFFSLHWLVWKFPLLPNEEVRDAFHDKEQPNTKNTPRRPPQDSQPLNPQITPHKQCVGGLLFKRRHTQEVKSSFSFMQNRKWEFA